MTQAANYTAQKTTSGSIEVVKLTDEQRHIVVTVVPSMGNNSYSMTVNGKEIFYIAPNRDLMSVEVTVRGTTLEASPARKLFGPIPAVGGHNYAVSDNGQRFLSYVLPQAGPSEPLTLLQNWTSLLKK